MYQVVFPKDANTRPCNNLSLKDAIKAKLALEVDSPGDKPVILDEDGYIVSGREQAMYIMQNLA